MATDVEKQPIGSESQSKGMRLQLLGPLTLYRNGVAVELPKSRKVRALTGYLALADKPLTRSALCELLWDAPSDPRSELRWCLSRIRSIVDDTDRSRVRFDLSPEPEFDRCRWVDYWRPVKEVVYFKRPVYVQALHELGPLAFPHDGPPPPPSWWPRRWQRALNRQHG